MVLMQSIVSRANALAACAVWFCAVTGANAHAAQITNKDSRSYKVTIKDNSGSSEHDLGAADMIDKICTDGCTLVLGGVEDGAYYLPEGNEMVSIEDGVLFFDGTVAPAAEKEE